MRAAHFMRKLPHGIHRPALGAEPDGHVTFEWHVTPERTLSVSVIPEGELHYSALISLCRRAGTEPFLGQCPDVIIELVQRVLQK